MKPAPPDVVAAVIAEAQKKYNLKVANELTNETQSQEAGEQAALPGKVRFSLWLGTELLIYLVNNTGYIFRMIRLDNISFNFLTCF